MRDSPTPDEYERLLELCTAAATQSNCDKIKYGAVAIDDAGTIVGVGYNHNPMPSPGWTCTENCVGGIRSGVKSGTNIERCFAVHAEIHAVLNSYRDAYEIVLVGIDPLGTPRYSYLGFYCTMCVRVMKTAGIKYVTVFVDGNPVRKTMQEAWDEAYAHVNGTPTKV